MDRYKTFKLTFTSCGVVPLDVARHAPRSVRLRVADPEHIQHVATVTSTCKQSLPVYEVYFADGSFYASGLINAQAQMPITIDESTGTPTVYVDISDTPGPDGISQASPSVGPILADFLTSSALIINGALHYRSTCAPFLLVSEKTIEKVRLKVIALTVTTRYPQVHGEIPLAGFPLFGMDEAHAFIGREVQRRREESKGQWFVDHWIVPSTVSLHFDGEQHRQALSVAYRLAAAESGVLVE